MLNISGALPRIFLSIWPFQPQEIQVLGIWLIFVEVNYVQHLICNVNSQNSWDLKSSFDGVALTPDENWSQALLFVFSPSHCLYTTCWWALACRTSCMGIARWKVWMAGQAKLLRSFPHVQSVQWARCLVGRAENKLENYLQEQLFRVWPLKILRLCRYAGLIFGMFCWNKMFF